MNNFKGKIVLVTGSNQNTGLEIAARFMDEGAQVIITGSSSEKTEKGISKLRERGYSDFTGCPADIRSLSDVKALFSMIKEKFGRLDVLVNNACNQGIGASFIDMDPDFFLNVIKTNLLGTFQVSQQAVCMMLKQESKGVIVNLGSNTSTRSIRNRTAYVASKGGLDSLTRSMALDLAPKGIRVNMVAPGYIYTDRWDVLDEDIKKRRRTNMPCGVESTGRDVANAVLFFASDQAKTICGERMVVDSGCTIQLAPVDVDI
ncbi:MAG: SDR family oxidoreductase [Kiritimatiellae bacterium]|jgi:NAD(P)-dependent dehydrogenase (short-subunit alcohol dehydrogenase family)|nr:SDR family oxidoreductase [Kiritimatiellia bacterium]